MKPLRVAVLGAGLSGLAAARRAQQAGHSVQVFERGTQVGGVVRSEQKNGWLIEHGPNTMQETAPVAALIQELGLGAERIEANPHARNRFVVRAGKLVPLPLSPPQFLAGPFFSAATKLKILRELWGGKPPAADSDPSFADFIRDRFGEEVLQYAAQPFVSGTYAGDPDRISVRHAFPRLWQSALTHGSLLRGQLAAAKERKIAGRPASPPLISFRSGMAVLPAALQNSLSPFSIAFGAEITGLRQVGFGWRIVDRSGRESAEFDQVTITLPAKAAAALTVERGTGSSMPFAFLGHIAHPPITSLFAGFRTSAIRHPLNGFGCLIPAVEKREILGILFSSSLFPGRAPEGCSALTIMLGGALQPDRARPTALEAWALAGPEVEALLGISEHPVHLQAVHYPQAIPQYNLGYGTVLSEIASIEQSHLGLHLRGSYRGGISVPDCLLG